MNNLFPPKVRTLLQSVLEGDGATRKELRRKVFRRTASLNPEDATDHSVPASLETYVDKIAWNAYKITDEEVDALREAGLSDEEIFELTICASLGAGHARFERGLALVDKVLK